MIARSSAPPSERRTAPVRGERERGFKWILARYERSLGWVLRHQPLTLAVTLATRRDRLSLCKVPKDSSRSSDRGG